MLQVSAADGTVLTVAPGVGLRKFTFDQVSHMGGCGTPLVTLAPSSSLVLRPMVS